VEGLKLSSPAGELLQGGSVGDGCLQHDLPLAIGLTSSEQQVLGSLMEKLETVVSR